MIKNKIKVRKITQIFAIVMLVTALVCGGTYSYLIAMDNKVNSIELVNPPPELRIGDIVNYSVTVNEGTENEVVLDDWKVFLTDENAGYVYMILSDYLPNVAISSDAITAGSLNRGGTYRVWTSSDRAALLNTMTTPSYWSNLVTTRLQNAATNAGGTAEATGGPTAGQFKDSWNTLYPGEVTITGDDTAGWSIQSLGNLDGYKNVAEEDNLYFPHKAVISDGGSNCCGYWLASPSTGTRPISVRYTGQLYTTPIANDQEAFRPVIRIPLSLLEEGESRGIWNIEYAGKYTVAFNANTGTGSMDNEVIMREEATNLTANTFTKSGYTFSHWNTKADGSGRSYNDKQLVTNLANRNETVTLYAQWYDSSLTKVKYAVQIYGINQDVDTNDQSIGLTFGPATGTNSYQNSYVTHEYEETSEGSGEYYVKIVTHTVASNGTETVNETPEYLTNSSSNRVVRTTAEKEAYDINLREMSWEEIEAVSDKSVFRDCMLCGDTKSVILTLNSTIRSGTRQTAYGDGAGMLRSTVNLYYCKWNPSKSDNSAVGTGVTLDSWDGKYGLNAGNAGGYKVSHIRATLIGSDVSNPTIGYAGDVNLTSSNCLYSCIESDLQSAITPKKVKYVTGSGSQSGQYQTNNTPLVDSIWLFSQREVYGTGQYSGMTTEGIGASGTGYNKFGDTESKYYIASYNDSNTDNRRAYNEAGSAFSWWLRSLSLSIECYVESVDYNGETDSGNALGTCGLGFGFCIGTPSSITYNANGGTGTMANQTICNSANLTTNSFTKSGFIFAGWNTKADGSGTSYADGATVSGLGEITLYAQWTVPPTVVSFNTNGGTGTMANQTITAGNPANLTTNSFTKSGYTFSHWNTEADGTGRSYNDKQLVATSSFPTSGAVTLYAQWYDSSLTKVKYAVQIYGINQDVDASNETLGLTFGPATGTNSYQNSYVTHEYEETSEGSGEYYVKIVTHTVAENGTETVNETPVYLTDSSSSRVVRSTAEKEAYDINLHEMSWAEIEAVSDKSVFRDCMLCGDTKSVNLTLNGTIMSGSTQTAYGDGAGMLYNTVNQYYRMWNPAKNNSTSSYNNSAVGTGVTLDSNEQKYGSNARNAGAYKVSHIRATLIGSDVSNPTIGYAGNVNLTSQNCLYSCIESDLQNLITPKKVKYVTGSGYSSGQYQTNNTPLVDAIWLFSEREMYGTGQYTGQTTEGIGASGIGYNKFGDTESKYYLTSYNLSNTDNRKAYTEAGSTSYWWLRSPYLYVTYSAYFVYSGGGMGYSTPYNTYGLAFGFCFR